MGRVRRVPGLTVQEARKETPGHHPRAGSQPRLRSGHTEGYSLYSSEVSSTPDETPVPRGTSTPSRVMLAEGSGVVLPKPAKEKARVR